MPKKKTKDEEFRTAPPLLVRVTGEVRDKAERYATIQHWSLSQLGSIALEEYLRKHYK